MRWVNRPDEQTILMKYDKTSTQDEFGFAKKTLIEIQEIHGVIQRFQDEDIGFKGEESNPNYTGYFLPEFIIDTDKLADYRIKYIRPHETQILKISSYNPNLFLRHTRDHIQLQLILEKKYRE
jgi:hypothetical protein